MNLKQTVQEIRAEIHGLAINFDPNKRKTLLETLSHQGFPTDKLLHLEPIIERLCSYDQVHIVDQPIFLAFEIIDSKLQQRPLQVTAHAVASYDGFVNRVINELTENPNKHYFIYSLADGTYPDSPAITKLVRYTTWTSKSLVFDASKAKI